MRPAAADRLPAVYDGIVTHARPEPVVNRFRYRTRMWLVDLAHLPALPRGLRWAARWESVDHVGDPRRSLRDNVAAEFERYGLDVTGCRLLLLAHPRSLGNGFNPISVHWAVDAATGAVRGVLAEVHNTYGGRHSYFVAGNEATGGPVTAQPAKRMYVSPFYGTGGRYRIQVSAPQRQISVSVSLHSGSGRPFVATLRAQRRPGVPGRWEAVRSAPAAWRTSALIRWQGLKLWRHGLGIHPRPAGGESSAAQSVMPGRDADSSKARVGEVA